MTMAMMIEGGEVIFLDALRFDFDINMTLKTLGPDNSQEINQKKQASANILHGS